MELKQKLCTADEAIALIKDGQTVVSGGFVGATHPEALTAAIERRYLSGQQPRDLTLVYAAGQGDGKDRGLNHLGHEGLVHRVVGGHWSLAPKLGKLAIDNKIEAYNFPQGVMCQLFRDIAAGRPGCITHIGLETFMDPIHCGGKLNERTTEDLVERVTLGGKTWLWYKSFPVHVGLIRATAADPCGNLVMDEEVMLGEILAIAQAVRNSGGIVIAQVAKTLDKHVRPQHVTVPGILVDHIVVADAHEHEQTFAETMNRAYFSPPHDYDDDEQAAWRKPMPADERRIIAARACDEVPEGAIANLGIGMPEGIARIAAERDWLSKFTLTVESGPIGGMPAGGLSFGAAVHPHAIVDQPAQFDFYDGRGLDFAALGAAQIDAQGNVNVSRFGNRLAGIGGFANITQTARKLVFCGTFTAGGLQVEVKDGKLHIVQEGKNHKFINAVQQLSFSAKRSREVGQTVLYVTERAVFELTDAGIELIEIAPGIDMDKQVLGLMAFRPIVRNVKQMPKHVFESF